MSSNIETQENMKNFMKEMLTASTHFGITCDEYLMKYEDIYKDTYAEHAFQLDSLFTEKFTYLNSKERRKIIEMLFESFSDCLKDQGDCIEEYLKVSIFRIPRDIILPEDENLQKAVDNYSKDEDEELTKQLEANQKSLLEKRAYIRNLKERIAMFDLCKNMLQDN